MDNPTFTSMRMDMWVDGARNVCSFHIQRPEGVSGLRYVSFYMDEKELRELATGGMFTLVDGYHNLNVCGDVCTFFDMEMPYRVSCGDMKVPFLAMHLPKRFWEYLLRVSRFVWGEQRKAEESTDKDRYYYKGARFEFDIPQTTLERFQSRFGQGRGKINLILSDKVRAKMVANTEVQRLVEHVSQIARNSTRSVYQTATARVSDASYNDDFNWSTFAPNGRFIMNGGINCHVRDGVENWSCNS
jgi:hypothetical protein